MRAPTAGEIIDSAAVRRYVDWAVNPTGAREPTVLLVNLEGRFLGAAALHDLVLRLGQSAASGALGPLMVVFATPDERTRETIRALARLRNLPVFLASSRERLSAAEPALELTPAKRATFDVLAELGGRATVGAVAEFAHLDHTTAGNRLAALDEDHVVFKVHGAGRHGHTYVDPRVAMPAEMSAVPSDPEFDLPAALQADLIALAEAQGRSPGAVLLEAWKEFSERHKGELARQHRDVGRALEAKDPSAIQRLSKQQAKARGQAAARRSQSGRSVEQGR